MDFKEKIRVVLDFPEKGIRFKDITTLLKDGTSFHNAVDSLAAAFKNQQIDIVVGPEARGFAVGAPVAYALGAGFVPVRKPGKLPAETIQQHYSLEYGQTSLEIHKDSLIPGQNVLIVDDLLATGGTTQATIALVEKLGGKVKGLAFMIELTYLQGRNNLPGYKIVSLVQY
ncbi:Adenine phosphoribosyltransferase [Propionispora sp. 2/2-37]|uniref:adenine phosphoribosyltransferase n=1 Tax=Propionispora sp. 2/2-37 TaxID=1677858 RepID=UPI0006BB72AF|nr:adenine phosphoribosyltransferase [Propionispora sp. 2/2-37]CUH94118.1 Adenine phosphoribosyltransferase [Propionispora sp. 2/2-37]